MKDIEDFQLAVGEVGTLHGVEYMACDIAGGCMDCDLQGRLCMTNNVQCFCIIFKRVEGEGIYAQENNCGYITLTNLDGTKRPVNVRVIARVEPRDSTVFGAVGSNARIYYIDAGGGFLNVQETSQEVENLIFNALKASKC